MIHQVKNPTCTWPFWGMFIFVVLLVACTNSHLTEVETGELVVIVADENLSLVFGATVKLDPHGEVGFTRFPPREANSDTSGIVIFQEIEVGFHRLEVDATGYEPYTVWPEIKENEMTIDRTKLIKHTEILP